MSSTWDSKQCLQFLPWQVHSKKSLYTDHLPVNNRPTCILAKSFATVTPLMLLKIADNYILDIHSSSSTPARKGLSFEYKPPWTMSATKCGGRGKHYCQGAAKSTHCHKKNPRSPQWSAHGHCRKLHTQGLDGYRGPRVQHREATDMGSRLDICHWTKAKPQMTHDILFTDEIPFIAIGPYILYKELPFVSP